MKEIKGLPIGIKVFTDFMSFSEAENIIEKIDSSIETDCGTIWDLPSTYSPDISCFRGNKGFNISEHGFKNTECFCGIKELDSVLGQTMMKAISQYSREYQLLFTQDEGFSVIRQDENHVEDTVIDDNPFVNRLISYNLALNVEEPIEYIRFERFDLDINIKQPAIVIFPSNYIYSYTKPKNEGLYEILNYFNNNPTEEMFDEVFGTE